MRIGIRTERAQPMPRIAIDRPGSSELASAIAAMAGGAGMTTIVEGLETVDNRRPCEPPVIGLVKDSYITVGHRWPTL